MGLANTEFSAKRAWTVLGIILLATGFISLLTAYQRPFWYDEICTVIVCRLPGASQVWKALSDAADTNPPLFYFIARIGHQLLPDEHLGYRLPSTLGLLGTVLCIYAILSRKVDRLSALAGATFILCTPVAAYAYEARPYALMLACVSAAIPAWQRIDDSKLYSLALAAALAAALSLHYYAILVWPAFAVAEAAIWFRSRRLRFVTWIALVAGTAPLLIFAELLSHLRQYYGQTFWARPSFGQIFSTSSFLFNVLDYWGAVFTIAAIVILLFWSSRKLESTLSIEDCALTVTLLLLPAIAVVAAKVSKGGMTSRYMLPTILGGALAVGYLTNKAPAAVRALLLTLMFFNYGLSSIPILKMAVRGGLLQNRTAATREVTDLVAAYQGWGVPIVISSGLRYLPIAYYTPPGQTVPLYALVDPPAAVQYSKTDSVDLALIVLQRYFPLHVEEFQQFSSAHREFILVSHDDSSFNYLPSKLLHDGNTLNLVSTDGNTHVYRVTLRALAP